jgi:hypothetical protein
VRGTSGTFGCLVRDRAGNAYVLSCAHVLSDGAAAAGDPIVQAGSAFGGRPMDDCIATFSNAIPLRQGVCVADAAIAAVVEPSAVTRCVRYLPNAPRGIRSLTRVGLQVKKSGDQTGLTEGTVIGINGVFPPMTVNGVSDCVFHNVIVTTGMSRSGDSGSLLVDGRHHAIGLLFAGLERPGPDGTVECVASWFSPIGDVLSELGVSLA